jgi:hypothetical protein
VLIENTELEHLDYQNIEKAIAVVEEVTVHINTSLKSDDLKEETRRESILKTHTTKKEKKYATIEINGKEEWLNLEFPSVSTHLSIIGQNQKSTIVKKYYEILSQERPSGTFSSSKDAIEDYSYNEEQVIQVEIVGVEISKTEREDGAPTARYLVKISGKHPENLNYIQWTLAKRYNAFHELNEKVKIFFYLNFKV